MGVKLWTPLSEGMRRRLFAGTMALVLNGALVSLIVFAPRYEPPAPDPTIVDVTFVSLPEPSAPDTTPEPDVEPEIEPEPEQQPETMPEPEPAAEPEVLPADTPVETSPAEDLPPEAPGPALADAIPPEDEDETTTSAGLYQLPTAPIPLPDGPGSTAEAVRAVFCLSSSDGNRRAGNCSEESIVDGQRLLQFASDENKARAAAAALAQLNAAQLQALLGEGGLPVRDLSGQATLADVASRPTSSADQMRDSLPPRHPDPAFGD